jgi:hypothetical protein
MITHQIYRLAVVGTLALGCVATAGAAATLQPPALSLKSKAGTQAGVQGSYCIRSETVTQCADSIGPHASVLAVVRPGERLVLGANAALNAPKASLGLVGCGTGSSKPFHRHAGVWRLAAPKRPGAYEVGVSTSFTTETVRGDTSVAFGILVSRHKARRIVPAARYAVC